jgi:hypothetical protein
LCAKCQQDVDARLLDSVRDKATQGFPRREIARGSRLGRQDKDRQTVSIAV